ncbi:hypothetical protein D3C80_1287770 [compost metagenome]
MRSSELVGSGWFVQHIHATHGADFSLVHQYPQAVGGEPDAVLAQRVGVESDFPARALFIAEERRHTNVASILGQRPLVDLADARQQGDLACFHQGVAQCLLRGIPQGLGIGRGEALEVRQLVHAHHHRQWLALGIRVELVAAVRGQDDLLAVGQHVGSPAVLHAFADSVGNPTTGQRQQQGRGGQAFEGGVLELHDG